MNKRILVSVLVLILACCLCASAVSLAAGGVLFFGGQSLADLLNGATKVTQATLTPSSTPQVEATQPATTQEHSAIVKTTTPAPGETVTAATEPVAEIPAEVSAQMDEIQTQVEHLRGLTKLEPVTRVLLTPAQLHDKIAAEFAEENDEQSLGDDLRVLSAFGLIEPGFDLYNFYLDLYSEQVAGYYDDKTKEMVVVQGAEFDGPERLTYAHEFTHILQDQYFGLRDGLKMDDEHCLADSEYCAAVTALIEGDASLTEQYWLYTYGSETDNQQIQDFYSNLQNPVYDTAPEFIKEDFGFSYTTGAEFVLKLFEKGGYTSIDNAYADPPVSTEQIMHPERYPHDTPVEVSMPDIAAALGMDWREIDRGVIGEWWTYLMLVKGRTQAIRLAEAQARLAAGGWGGDSYVVYQDNASGDVLVAARWKWDTLDDSEDFYDSLKYYGSLRWGQPDTSSMANTQIWLDTTDGAVIVQSDGLGTSWVMAPDFDTAAAILQMFGEGVHAWIN